MDSNEVKNSESVKHSDHREPVLINFANAVLQNVIVNHAVSHTEFSAVGMQHQTVENIAAAQTTNNVEMSQETLDKISKEAYHHALRNFRKKFKKTFGIKQ